MEYDKLTRQLVLGGIEYTVVRPGISLCLLYAEPAERIAPASRIFSKSTSITFRTGLYKLTLLRMEGGRKPRRRPLRRFSKNCDPWVRANMRSSTLDRSHWTMWAISAAILRGRR